jgi:hypothetical protein
VIPTGFESEQAAGIDHDAMRPYGAEQVRRSEMLLNEPALPIQTLRIVRERLNEALSLIRVIDADANRETKHGHPAKR